MNRVILSILSLPLLLVSGDLDSQGPDKNFWAYSDRRFPYDGKARALRMAGSGVYRIQVDRKTGRVTGVEVVKSTGWKHLDDGAVQTMLTWRARPNAARADVTVPITFNNSPHFR